MDARAVSPVVGVVILAGTTVVLAAVVGTAVLATTPQPAEPASSAFSLTVDGHRVSILHVGGDALDVRRLRVVVAVEGEPLARQPPVPFFAASGFESGPTGPFNVASDPTWSAGETASFGVAETNAPVPEPGDTVEVSVYRANATLVTLTATAR